MKIIIWKDNYFYISFPFNKRINFAVMKLPDAQLNTKYKRWEVDARHRDLVFNFGEKYGFQLPEGKSKRKVFDTPISEMPKLNRKIDLKMTLRGYQEEGVAFPILHGSCINGDAVGTGKTAETIATIIALNLFPCLIICPANLKLNWLEEWQLWTDKHKALILTDSTKHTYSVFYEMGMFDVFIVNYESLKKYFVVNIKTPHGEKLSLEHVNFHPNINIFKSVCCDESHRLADVKTIQSKLSYGITRGKELSLLLSGTPIVNKPIDLLPQLMAIDKINYFGGVKGFREMAADEDRWVEINYILRKHCYFRRDKAMVLTELPALTRQKVYCNITNQNEYDEAIVDLERYYREWKNATDQQIAKSMRAKALVQLGVLKSISARGKISDFMEYASDILLSGEKIVVFVYLKEVVDELRKTFPDALFYTGSETEVQKDKAKYDFQKCVACGKKFERHGEETHDFEPSDKQLFFVNYKAGGVGITLTAASIMVHLELPWNQKDVEQDEGRCHRMSQKNAVQDSFFIGKGTVDEYIYQIIAEKREMSGIITGAEDNTEEVVMENILELMMKK